MGTFSKMVMLRICRVWKSEGSSYPDLSLHSILAGPTKDLDPEVLLDPFKEQFDLPARLLEQADGECG
jgi:hypothetical protein